MFRRFKYADNAVIVGIVEFRQESGFGQLFQPLCASSKGNPKVHRPSQVLSSPVPSCSCLITKACRAHRTSENALTRRDSDKRHGPMCAGLVQGGGGAHAPGACSATMGLGGCAEERVVPSWGFA
ncbi:uncharacterized protein LOC144143463 isoform X2 [Haemaphysalis longicornis]